MEHQPICLSYIRFSTPEQLKGDSLRRQLHETQKYAEEKGWKLDDSLTFRDFGISAYSGAHRTKGALGKLLELIDQGKIPPGSTLIIESLDRLSRESVMEALGQFISILKKGISIVTFSDRMEYNDKSDMMQLMFSLMVMSRAHEESSIKARRLKQAWINKRAKISKRKLTALAPAWLKLNRRKQEFDLIEDRADIVRRIFRLYLDGCGAGSIAKILNSEGIPAWKSKTGWFKSYIKKILSNIAVIGQYQPHIIEKDPGGKKRRVPEGPVVKDYFPAVIEEQAFYRVQKRLMFNEGKGGRNGKIKNLFVHRAKCGYCGSPMTYLDKGNDWQYLKCSLAHRGLGCNNASFRYDEFERAFLGCCAELDLAGLLPSDDDAARHAIQDQRRVIEGLKGELVGTDRRINNIHKQIELAGEGDGFEDVIKNANDRLKILFGEKTALSNALRNAEEKLTRLAAAKSEAQNQLKNVNELVRTMEKADEKDRIAIRKRLRIEIQQLIKRIEVFPDGTQDKILNLNDSSGIKYRSIQEELMMESSVAYATDIHETEKEHEAYYAKRQAKIRQYIQRNTGKEQRRFGIWFEAGGFRQVCFDPDGRALSIAGKNDLDLWKSIVPDISQDPLNDSDLELLKSIMDDIDQYA